MPERLSVDQKRQASDSIRGYHYQMWQSVHAWLELQEDEVLYIEGAEDLDIVCDTESTAVQIKNTQANVTLRSRSIVDAITHYWELRNKHPNVKIRFRYVTTAGIGVEQGTPFGPGVAGIDYWHHCIRNADGLDLLRQFFISESRLPKELIWFIRNASDNDLITQLLDPITWETDCPAISPVQEAVKRKLVYHGDRLNVFPSKSEAVADRLLTTVLEVASSKRARSLTRRDFLKEFEDATTERISSRELQALRNMAGQMGAPFGFSAHNQAVPTIYGMSSAFFRGIPEEAPGLLLRSKLLVELKQQLNQSHVLCLKGSTGMGKTTLAKWLAKNIGGTCLWTSLTGYTNQNLRDALHYTGIEIDTYPDTSVLVLDDIDLEPTGARIIEDTLGGLIYTAITRDMYIIVISHRDFPRRLKRSLQLCDDLQCVVPKLTADEITVFLENHGCPGNGLSRAWALLVFGQTSGHPQLVHARVCSLKTQGWPLLSEDEITTPPRDIIAERADARGLLQYLSQDEIGLIYRLSALTGPFRRDHAIALGEIDPALSNTGLLFDTLVGPWVEHAISDYYRLSPLLTGAADNDWTNDKIKQFRVLAAHQILKCGKLTYIEAREVLLLGLLTHDVGLLFPIVNSLLNAPQQHWSFIATEFSWVVFYGTKMNQALLPENPHVNFSLRIFQFRVAVETLSDEGTQIVSLVEREFLNFADENIRNETRYIFAMLVCTYYQVAISGKYFIKQLQILEDNKDARAVPADFITENSQALTTNLPAGFGISQMNPVLLFFIMSAPRCSKDGFLEEMLDALAETSESFRNYLLAVLTSPLATLMVSAVVLNEADKNCPDWDACRVLFAKVQHYAEEWHCTPLIEAAARATAMVIEEYQGDSEKALQILDAAGTKLSEQSYVLDDARATTLFHHGQTRQALDIWLKTLPQWPEPPSNYGPGAAMYSCNNAGIGAMRLAEWKDAQYMFLEGARRAELAGLIDVTAGYIADAAYAAWKDRDVRKAVELFSKSLRHLETLQDVETDLGTYTVYKLVGATIMWCANTEANYPLTGNQEPIYGWCSSPERNEKIRELPLGPLDYSWLNLVTLEYYGGSGSEIFNEMGSKLESTSYPEVRALFANLNIHRDYQSHTFVLLPKHLSTLFSEIDSGQESVTPEFSSPRNVDKTKDTQASDFDARSDWLIGGLLVAFENGVNIQELTNQWSANISYESTPAFITNSIVYASEIFRMEYHEAESILTDRNCHSVKRLLAAVRICMLEESSPAATLYAHVLLLNAFMHSFWPKEIGEALSMMLSRQWLKLCDYPAVLRTPRLTVPTIKESCGIDREGISKSAKIILAATNAVSLHIPQEQYDILHTLAS